MWTAVKIVQDSTKGRCLEACKAFNVGDVLYTETAFVLSSCKDLPMHQCFNYCFQAFKPNEVKLLQEMTYCLAALSRVNSIDTARNVLELVALYRLRASNELKQSSELIEKFQLFGELTAANLPECIENMKEFRKAFPSVIPRSVNDAAAGALLGILNTNQVEVESESCGSGLFVGTAVAEHNCTPNASYSTSGDLLTMTAIRPIAPGERVSIDYGNYYYDSTPERLAALYESYNFLCTCDTCRVWPDRKRAFVCRRCNPAPAGAGQCSLLRPAQEGANFNYCHGIVTPVGCTAQLGTAADGEATLSVTPLQWVCGTCGDIASPALVALYENAEQKAMQLRGGGGGAGDHAAADSAAECMDEAVDDDDDEAPLSFEQLLSIVDAGILHPSHHVVFWGLADLSMSETQSSREQVDALQAAGLRNSALHHMTLLSRYIELFLPAVHHEKMVHYDRLAQLYVAMVQPIPTGAADRSAVIRANVAAIANAKQCFSRAHQCCTQSCGLNAPITKHLHELAENTPTNISDLAKRYANTASAGDAGWNHGMPGDATDLKTLFNF